MEPSLEPYGKTIPPDYRIPEENHTKGSPVFSLSVSIALLFQILQLLIEFCQVPTQKQIVAHLFEGYGSRSILSSGAGSKTYEKNQKQGSSNQR
tara:strand:+ start:28388 stop:28669 length:282 start_codon:yes stop_codon:yes gene_type:complete